jgi:hypothetical protein
MKNAVIAPMPTLDVQEVDDDFPDEAELAAIRGWYAGLGSRETVARYLGVVSSDLRKFRRHG